jgi:hypothetical protein
MSPSGDKQGVRAGSARGQSIQEVAITADLAQEGSGFRLVSFGKVAGHSDLRLACLAIAPDERDELQDLAIPRKRA